MKKITSQKISKRLVKYGALSAAIAGVADASGQIIYTDVNPDQTIIGGDYFIDMDNDGINPDQTVFESMADEFQFRQTNNNALGAPLTSSDALLGIAAAYNYPFALSSGATISSGQTTWIQGNGYFQTMNYNSCGYPSSQWCGVTDRFLGLRFNIGGNTHYGWIRLDATLSPMTGGFTIKDYAYNATPDAPINAGQTTLGIDDKSLQNIKVIALNKSIGLYNLPETTDYTLYNIAGQKVLNGKINNSTYVIEANSVSSGVYIIEIVDSNTKAVLRKKVVL